MRKTIRQEFWIICMENLVKHTIKHCVDCNKANSEAASQGLAPLTIERLSLKETCPLHTIAVDVFGHFTVTNQWQPRGAPKKVWILVAICMKTSFMIAHPLYSLDLDNLLVALKALSSRYCGRIKRIQSDNYSTFNPAGKEIEKFFKNLRDQIELTASRVGTEWTFTPVYSAWYNGLVKKSGGLLKKCLQTAFKGQQMGHVDFEQAIQSCVCMANQRPILPIQNAKGQIIVSPANLLFGDYAMNYVLQFDETSTKADLRGRWRQRQQIYSSFENLWHSS